MKRSEINENIAHAAEFWEEHGFLLPPFAFFTPGKWTEIIDDPGYTEIRENALGWDITDFGLGNFEKDGLLLFTIRNGNYYKPQYVKPYAEKIMLVREEQTTPFHFHTNKMEDIINRGGGNLLVQVYNSAPDGELADTPVTVFSDGRKYTVDAGSIVRLTPGESMTMTRGLYHAFWGEAGKGEIMVGEVSAVNDDRTDNRFLKPTGRFPDIDEDVAPLWLLGQDYAL